MPGRLVRPRIYGEQRALFLYPFVQEVGVDFMKGTPGYTMHGTPMKIIIKIKRTLLVHRDRAREREMREREKRETTVTDEHQIGYVKSDHKLRRRILCCSHPEDADSLTR